MNYIDTASGQYPVTEREIKLAYPNVSFSQPFVAPEPYAPVFETPRPDHDALTQMVREIAPVLTAKGHYEQRWEVVALDAETVAANREARKAELTQQIAARRYAAETAGITVSGIRVDTSRDSQALITGAALSAMRDPAYVCRWKTPVGFVELDAPEIMALADAVRAHVQACFDREAELLTAIEEGEYSEEMLEEGWPDGSVSSAPSS